jgi:methylglyoxal synthase
LAFGLRKGICRIPLSHQPQHEPCFTFAAGFDFWRIFAAMNSEEKADFTIAIIAHDGKKAEMVAFVRDHADLLHRNEIKLIATGTTGMHVERAGFIVEKLASGPYGGDAQIASRIVEGKIQMVVFFRDPLGKHPHEVDVSMLMRICDVHNIPLATNPATATCLFNWLV